VKTVVARSESTHPKNPSNLDLLVDRLLEMLGDKVTFRVVAQPQMFGVKAKQVTARAMRVRNKRCAVEQKITEATLGSFRVLETLHGLQKVVVLRVNGTRSNQIVRFFRINRSVFKLGIDSANRCYGRRTIYLTSPPSIG